MPRRFPSMQVQTLLSLITLTQLTAASPLPYDCEDVNAPVRLDAPRLTLVAAPRIPLAAAPSDMPGVLPMPPLPLDPVVEISDGQIQAPYHGQPLPFHHPQPTVAPSTQQIVVSQPQATLSTGSSHSSIVLLSSQVVSSHVIPEIVMSPAVTVTPAFTIEPAITVTPASTVEPAVIVTPASSIEPAVTVTPVSTISSISTVEPAVSVAPSSMVTSASSVTPAVTPTPPSIVAPAVSLIPASTMASASSVAPLTPSSTGDLTVTASPTVIPTTTVPDTALTSLTTSAVQSATQPVSTNTFGSLHTSLETSGVTSRLPFVTVVPTATAPLSLISSVFATPTVAINGTMINVNEIFRPIATDAPPAQISQRGDHPVPRLGITPQQKRLETNKFYANLFLGSQTSGVFTLPYVLNWLKGSGSVALTSWGMSIAHSERTSFAYGPAAPVTGAASYYASPLGIHPIVLSAAQLGVGSTLTTDSLAGFSVNANLVPAGASSPMITFPLVQGMAFTTAQYNGGATPLIESTVGIINVTYVGAIDNNTGNKYRFTLSDKSIWLIYVFTSDTTYAANTFTLLNPNRVQGPSGFTGYIQVAKIPVDIAYSANYEATYDTAAGVYPTAASISGTVDGTVGTYSLSWTKAGATDKTLLIFALPHHVSSFSDKTKSQITGIQLMTPTKGIGLAVLADSWTLSEPNLPISMNFAPWSQAGSLVDISPQAQQLVNSAATSELAQNISQQTSLNSMYFSGKALSKFAAIVYAAHDMAHNATLALTGLQSLKSSFEVFVNNQQINPLVYDTAWGGAVSISSYLSGNAGDDFGNTYYNDHHFHYGYFVYAAAVIGYLDPAWLTPLNKAWVEMLIRDYANPADSDPYFPFSRSFDWYHGHSWAKGLFESADGKDQESSSEDTMASYAIKMWGKITGDVAMEARGNLMLAVQARSLADYYLYTSDNSVEPPRFIPNKVAGILFENKIDHTTYFGNAIEDIEGIHMIPIMPFSTLTRRATFVSEEWNTYFTTYINSVTSGWRGILMANLAIVDAKTSFDFFANSSGTLSPGMLDGGASQTWYIAYSAALGGSPHTSK